MNILSISPWSRRPFEVAYLLNPAFCALVIREGAFGYQQDTQEGLPYSLSFLLLPITLHEATRNKLPYRITTKLHSWLGENQEVKIGFPERTRNLVPYVKEAMIFGMRSNAVELANNGHIIPMPGVRQPKAWNNISEITDYLKAARFIGRWFAQVRDPGTIYYMWGIQP